MRRLRPGSLDWPGKAEARKAGSGCGWRCHGGSRGGGRRPERAPRAARAGRRGGAAAEPPGAAPGGGGAAAQALVLAGPLAVRAGGSGAVPGRVPVAVMDCLVSTSRS